MPVPTRTEPNERPVPLIVPPETVPHTVGEVLPLPTMPTPPPDKSVVLGLAAVDHSGRVRDRVVLAALRWGPGDRINTSVRENSLLLRRAESGVSIDARGRVFLPLAARSLLGIAVDERVVLVGAPQQQRLIMYPTGVFTTLLVEAELEVLHACRR